MKGIYSVAILTVATLATFTLSQSAEFDESTEFKIPTKCPAIDPENTTIHLAHKDCTKFYMCLRGEKIEMECPFRDKNGNRLHFNPELQVCDWPDHAGCKNPGPSPDPESTPTIIITPTSTTITPKTTSTTPNTILTITITPSTAEVPSSSPTPKPNPSYCPKDTNGKTIQIPHEFRCELYYKCTDGKTELQLCPAGTLFNPNPKVLNCDWIENVKCNGMSTIGPSLPKCPPKGSGETKLLPHECQCDRYYKCEDGEMILKRCSPGQEYDYVRQICGPPEIVKCVRPIPQPTVKPAFTISHEWCLAEEEGMKYKHESICSSYYECVNERKVLKHCPTGLRFNFILQICDYPDKECAILTPKLPEIPSALITEPEKFTSSCIGKKNGKRVSHEYDCSKYYECQNGYGIIQTCSKNLNFNPVIEVCDFPENVHCGSPPSEGVQCPAKGVTRIPHEDKCNFYYDCYDGRKTLNQCPSNLHFNPVLKICDFPENYPCDQIRVEPTILYDKSGCIGNCPWEDPDNYTILIPNVDCHKFCMCGNGIAYEQTCPEGLNYDYLRFVCDYPPKVKCKVPPKEIYKINEENENEYVEYN